MLAGHIVLDLPSEQLSAIGLPNEECAMENRQIYVLTRRYCSDIVHGAVYQHRHFELDALCYR